MQKTLRGWVFFPPFILLLAGTLISVVYQESFFQVTNSLHLSILKSLGSLYGIVALIMVLTCFLVFVSPLGKVRIGGSEAKPQLNLWQWFTISLCSTIACGLLFWGTAEPLFHFFQPPLAHPQSDKVFALASLLLHWTFTPYAIYTVPALLFALNFHNNRAELSFASCLYPLLSVKQCQKVKALVDSLCLYSLAIGMSSSLAAGILILWGGINHLFLLPKNMFTLGAITVLIVFTFVGAAASGVLKGIRVLADWNVKLFACIILYVMLNANLQEIFTLSMHSAVYLSQHFLELSLWPAIHPEDPWGYQWGTFYWAAWMSWAPITALFLGKIAKGYTVREFILMNFFVPCLFSFIWMSLFGGLALTYQPLVELYQIIIKLGPEAVIYFLMEKMPFATVLIGLFLVTCFLSFVTAADSNTVAMADISSTASEESSEKKYLKFVWGGVLGLLSLITILAAGIDGIRILANFSGIPALFLLTWVLFSLLKLNWLFMYRRGTGVVQQQLVYGEE